MQGGGTKANSCEQHIPSAGTFSGAAILKSGALNCFTKEKEKTKLMETGRLCMLIWVGYPHSHTRGEQLFWGCISIGQDQIEPGETKEKIGL